MKHILILIVIIIILIDNMSQAACSIPPIDGLVEIPFLHTSIGIKDFDGCTDLKIVIFEKPVQILSIPSKAFKDTVSLISITIPGIITSIASDAFSGASGFIATIDYDSPLGLSSGLNQTFFGATNVSIIQGGEPTGRPSSQPSGGPTSQPTSLPTSQPTCPSGFPTTVPTGVPSTVPTTIPTSQPSGEPSSQPTMRPTGQPTTQPSGKPSGQPSSTPTSPSGQPTSQPSGEPSSQPTGQPSSQPSSRPTAIPTAPSGQPTGLPTMPTGQPTTVPSVVPSTTPTSLPSGPTPSPTPVPTIDVYTEMLVEINTAQINSVKSMEETAITGLLQNVKTDSMQVTVDQVPSDRFATFHYTWLDDEELPQGEEKFLSGSCGEWDHFLSDFNSFTLDFQDHYGAYLSYSHFGERGEEATVTTCNEPQLVKKVLKDLLDISSSSTSSSSSSPGDSGIYTKCPSTGDTFWVIHRCSNGVVLCVGTGSDCGIPNSCQDIDGSDDSKGRSSLVLASELSSYWLAPCLNN